MNRVRFTAPNLADAFASREQSPGALYTRLAFVTDNREFEYTRRIAAFRARGFIYRCRYSEIVPLQFRSAIREPARLHNAPGALGNAAVLKRRCGRPARDCPRSFH